MSDSPPSSRLELVFVNLLLRLWVGLRLFMAGLDKFRGGKAGNDTLSFSMENYEKKSGLIAKLIHENGMLPEALCNAYAKPLGFLLIIAGVWAVIGLASRLGLLFCGLMFLSLGFGLATLPDDTEIVYIGLSVLIVAAALATNPHNRISVDGLLKRNK